MSQDKVQEIEEKEKIKKDTINILIVEDEDMQYEIIEDSIGEANSDDGSSFNIEYTRVSSFNDSLLPLIKDDYDAAIIDLQLDKTKTEEDGFDGINLIEIITHKLRFPVFVRTGFPGKIETPEHDFFRVYDKDANVDEIISQIINIYTKGFTTTVGTKGKLEQYLNDIFWNRLSKSIDRWDETILTSEDHEKALVRYCVTLLSEHLELNDNLDDLEVYHPAEFYIYPPIKPYLFFGDILYDNEFNKYFIILSPACDMAQQKFDKVVLADVEEYTDILAFTEQNSIYSNTEGTNRKQRESAYKKMQNFVRNNHSLKYHFLPKFLDFPGGFVNFQKVRAEDISVLQDFRRYATVSEKFAKDIAARFSQYYSRQGQPDLNPDILIKNLIE